MEAEQIVEQESLSVLLSVEDTCGAKSNTVMWIAIGATLGALLLTAVAIVGLLYYLKKTKQRRIAKQMLDMASVK